jgi:hypothetical protein
MKRPKARELKRLHRRILAPDEAVIDELYGLEPVFEPGAGLQPTEFVAVLCLTSSEASYVEDCEVCCRPIEFSIEREADGALLSVGVRRLD